MDSDPDHPDSDNNCGGAAGAGAGGGGGDGGSGGDDGGGGDGGCNMMIDNSCGNDGSSGGDQGNNGNNCSPTDPTCGPAQPPDDQQGCTDLAQDPTCGGMLGGDPCANPMSAECGNPWAAQGLPFLSPELNMSPANDPCVYMNDAGTGIESIDQNSSPRECSQTGGLWVQPSQSTMSVGPDGFAANVLGCAPYADGTGAGQILFNICMNAPNNQWGMCVRGKLAQQYVPNGNPLQLGWYLFVDHPEDFAVCALR